MYSTMREMNVHSNLGELSVYSTDVATKHALRSRPCLCLDGGHKAESIVLRQEGACTSAQNRKCGEGSVRHQGHMVRECGGVA